MTVGSTHRRTALAATAVYVAVVSSFRDEPGRVERSVFAAVNEAGDHPALRVPQQWGTPWSLPVLAALALAAGRPREAVARMLCLPVSKGIEVATKELLTRPRPFYTQPTILRDDAPLEGGSMPSGHAALAACCAYVLWQEVPVAGRAVLVGLTGISAWVRVHQGAHQPADVLAGTALGVATGASVSGLVEAAG